MGVLTLYLLDDLVVVGLRDADAVDADDDVILPDSGAVSRPALPHGLHEDRLVSGKGQSVAEPVLVHQEIPENANGRMECCLSSASCWDFLFFVVSSSKCRKLLGL